MVIYEVNLAVAQEIRAEYSAWLRLHVEQMLEFDGFRHASIAEVDRKLSTDFLGLADNEDGWTTLYEVESLEKLEAYFRDHAERMRADGLARFGGKFRASRRVLKLLAPENR